MRESRILRAAKRAAKREGLLTVRLHFGPGAEVGWPDLQIIGPRRQILWMETKAPGGKVRPIQGERHRVLASYDHEVVVPFSVKEAVDAISDFAEACRDAARC